MIIMEMMEMIIQSVIIKFVENNITLFPLLGQNSLHRKKRCQFLNNILIFILILLYIETSMNLLKLLTMLTHNITILNRCNGE